MDPRRLLATLLALALLGTLVAAPATGEEPSSRDLHDAAAFKFATEAIVAAQGTRAGATWKSLDAATRKIVGRRIQRIKEERESLARLARAELDLHTGKEHECERALIEQAWKEADAGLERYLVRLRHVRGDQRKALTKMGRSINQHVLKPLGKVAKEALKKSLPELAAIYIGGGGLSRAIAKSVLKRHVVRIARREGRDLLVRAVTRRLRGPGAVTTEEALEAACGEQDAAASLAPSAVDAAASGTDHELVFDSVCGVTPEVYGSETASFAPLPPYDEPATLIYFDWVEKADVILHYGVARDPAMFEDGEPAKDPAEASVAAGCSDGSFGAGAIDGCWAALPIVLTESEYPGAWNWAQSPGTYSILVQSPGACWYGSDDGVDWGRIDAVDGRGGELAVTATMAHYHAGEAEPYRIDPPIPISVPRGPSARTAIASEGPIDMAPYTRVAGPIEWDPTEALALEAEGTGGESE